jgi:hypothetical protein
VPDTIIKGITATSTPLKILTIQEEVKTLKKEFDLQGAVTNIVIQHIIDSVEEQYIEKVTKSTLGMPTTSLKVSSTISEPTGARE